MGAVVFSLCPLAATAIIGLAIYQVEPTLTGITIICTIGIVAIWLGYKIFRITLKYGANQIMTGLHSAPDIDEFVEKMDNEDESNNRL